MTAGVGIRLKNSHGYSPTSSGVQFAWPRLGSISQQSLETQILEDGSSVVVGTNYATEFAGLYAKVQQTQQNGKLRAYVDSFQWRKCGTGSCTNYAETSITSQHAEPMDVNTLVSFIRTPTVYVDKPKFWVYFKITDAQGSPIFASHASNGVSLAGSSVNGFDQRLGSLSCTTGTSLGSLSSTGNTWMYTCSGSALEAQFSDTNQWTGNLNITASSNTVVRSYTVGGGTWGNVDVQNALTLAQKPHWWHTGLRAGVRGSLPFAYSTSYDLMGFPATPSQPVVITCPTYPIYEAEAFDVHVYNAATYSSNLVYGFTIHVKFNTSQVEYVSVAYDNLFPGGDTNEDAVATGQVTLTATSSQGTIIDENGAATPDEYVNGFFPYARIRFRRKQGAVVTGNEPMIDTGIRVNVAEVINDGNQAMKVADSSPEIVMQGSSNIYASIFDARTGGGTFGGTPTAGLHILAATQNDRFLFYNYAAGSASTKDHGHIFNRRAIDGSNVHDTEFQATVVNDYFPYSVLNTAHNAQFYTTQAMHLCAPDTNSSSENYEALPETPVSTCSLRTKIALGTDMNNSRIRGTAFGHTCIAQPSGVCTGTVDLRIVSPQSLAIQLSNPTLKRIVSHAQGASCSTTDIHSSAYQTTVVRVIADGLDITSWATGMRVENTTVAEFISQPGVTGVYTRNLQDQVRGKVSGSTSVVLHDQAGAVSAQLVVNDTELAVLTDVVAKVVTDVVWKSGTPGSLVYPASTTAEVTVKQVFTSRPAGTSRGHYGYLFVRAHFDDGTTEEVLHQDIATIVRTPNLIFTPPGASDEHANSSDLVMYNQNTHRYMVTLPKTASSECVESTVQVNFTRCDATIGVGFPSVNIIMPDPIGIQFNISTNLGPLDLTPTNDGASFSPFRNYDTTDTSSFRLVLLFEDGSTVATFAEEADSDTTTILFYSTDESCATVDNTANTLTVVEGATCSEVEIRVNVTLGNLQFFGRDVAPLVRLQTLSTSASAYPAGDDVGAVSDLIPLPCNAGFERFTLQSQGALSTGTLRTISSSSVVTYVSSDPAIATLSGTNRVVAASAGADGTAMFGATAAEFASGWNTDGVPWNSAGVTIQPFTVNVYRAYDASKYNFDASVWNNLPGGAETWSASTSPSGTSTINVEKDGIHTSTFTLSYTREGPNGNVSFTFHNLAQVGNGAWFRYQDIVSYWSGTPTVMDINSLGTFTLRQNYHLPVQVEAFLCANGSVDSDGRPVAGAYSAAPNAYTKKYLWANLRPSPEDVDVGTNSLMKDPTKVEQGAPFYYGGSAANPGGYLTLHVIARPKHTKFLRSAEVKIVLPDVEGLSSSDFEWTTNDQTASPYEISANANFENLPGLGEGRLNRVLKIVALHPATIPTSNAVYLGSWTAPNHKLVNLSTGLHSDGIVTEIVELESVDDANSKTALTPLFVSGDAVAGTGTFYVGAPSRRRLARGGWGYLGPLVFKTNKPKRAPRHLQSCDPCGNLADRVYGDANGDCKLTVADATFVQKMIGTRSAYADAGNARGSISVDPVHSLTTCNFTRQQFNPLLDTIVPYDTPNDYRATVSAPHIGVTDVTHIIRACAMNAVFIEPTTQCVASSAALGVRPDALVSTRVYGNNAAEATAIMTSNLHIHYDILVVGQDAVSNPNPVVDFNVTHGTLISSRDVEGVAHPVPAASTYAYSPVSEKSVHSAVVLATYDAGTQEWVAQLQPHNYTGDIDYYVAVLSGVGGAGGIVMPDGYAVWLGSAVAPFGEDRFSPGDGMGFKSSYKPVIGDKSSIVQNSATTCPHAMSPPPLPPFPPDTAPLPPPPLPPPSPPPPSPPPPSPPPLPPPSPPPPSPPPSPISPAPSPPLGTCALDFLRAKHSYLYQDSYEHGPDGTLVAEFRAMEAYHRQAIEENSYSYSQSSFACSVRELPFLACLDIGGPGTFTGNPMQPAIDWNTPAPDVNYKNVSSLYFEDSNAASGYQNLFGINCTNAPNTPGGLLHGDGVINSYDIGVLVFALFRDAPYDSLPDDEKFYQTVGTVEQRPETQSRCGDNETRADWQMHLYANGYCPASYVSPPTPPPPSPPPPLFMLVDDDDGGLEMTPWGRKLSDVSNRDEAFVRTRFTGANELGSWYSFEFATNIIPIILEMIVHGIWVTGRSQLSNAPPPIDGSEVPVSPEFFQLRWARTPEQMTYGKVLNSEVTTANSFVNTPTCKSIVSGATGLRSIMGDTISIRQEGQGGSCPFWLFLWVPIQFLNTPYARALAEANANASNTLLIWPKRGSTAMTTTGGVVLSADATEAAPPISPPPPPSLPLPPPMLPPPAPPPVFVKELNATQALNIDNAYVEEVIEELDTKFARIKTNLVDFVFGLVGQNITVYPIFEELPNATLELEADNSTRRRLLEEPCYNGATLKVVITFTEAVTADIIEEIKKAWPDIANYSDTDLNECGEVIFEEEQVPAVSAPEDDKENDMPLIVFVLSLIGVSICCICMAVLQCWPCVERDRSYAQQSDDTDGSPLLLRNDWLKTTNTRQYTKNEKDSQVFQWKRVW